MLGCKGEISGGSSYGGGFKKLLYNGFFLWLGQCSSNDCVISRDTHVDHSDDDGQSGHIDGSSAPYYMGFECHEPWVSKDNVFSS